MKPLDDVSVVDLTRILSGPICTMLMGDMGARIVKVEPPPDGDDSRKWGPPFVGGISSYFLSVNRNKQSLGLNLKNEAGREILWKMIDRADVVVENFRPGVLDRLGFSYAEVSERNRRVVYCSISGFGQTGPYRDRPGYDVIAQGESGMMDLTGEPDRGPVKIGGSLADIVTGLYAFHGILLALLARHRSGRGQHVDISLLDSMVSTLAYQAEIYLTTGRSPTRMGSRHPSIVPYESFQATDGFINIAVTNQKQWENFCNVMEFPEVAIDPRFDSNPNRIENYEALKVIIDRTLRNLTRTEITKRLSAVGIPVGPINTVGEILEDPHIRAREMVGELTHPEYGPLRMLGIPIKLSDTAGALEAAPPRFGEHNSVTLEGLGYGETEIADLVSSGALCRAQ